MNIDYFYADVNHTRLYCEAAGSGKAVVLIHGFTLDTRMWDDQFLPLAQYYRVIRYDLRGFGKSALPTSESYSDIEDLEALLKWLEIERAYLVGLSMGGGVAIDFALTYPSRVEALVLIDTVLGGFQWSPEASARDNQVFQWAREGGIAAARTSWLSHPLFEAAMRNPMVAARLAQIVNDYSGWHFINSSPARRIDPPAVHRLSELSLPLLALVGEMDIPDFRLATDFICRELSQSHKIVVPGVGHMANMEAPELVTQAILSFLNSTGINDYHLA